jgi:uncharacterized protein
MPNTLRRTPLLQRHRWLTCLLPFLVYTLGTMLEPSHKAANFGSVYPVVYTLKIALTLAAVAFVWPGYREFPWRLSPLAVAVGLVGGPLWIGLCWPNWENLHLWPWFREHSLGWLAGAERPAFNPFASSHDLSAAGAWTFIVIRFLGLAAVIPLIEEFFLRGFLMRFVMERDWWNVPFGRANALAIVLGTAAPMLSHPELLAALVWFSMITWLMLRTRNIWDCIVAHAITNLILGIYVVAHGGEAWRML